MLDHESAESKEPECVPVPKALLHRNDGNGGYWRQRGGVVAASVLAASLLCVAVCGRQPHGTARTFGVRGWIGRVWSDRHAARTDRGGLCRVRTNEGRPTRPWRPRQTAPCPRRRPRRAENSRQLFCFPRVPGPAAAARLTEVGGRSITTGPTTSSTATNKRRRYPTISFHVNPVFHNP